MRDHTVHAVGRHVLGQPSRPPVPTELPFLRHRSLPKTAALGIVLTAVLTSGLALATRQAARAMTRQVDHLAQSIRILAVGAHRSTPAPAANGEANNPSAPSVGPHGEQTNRRAAQAAVDARLPKRAAKQPPSTSHHRPMTVLKASWQAPRCDDVSTYIISIFEDPKESVATLALDPRLPGSQRRVGQRFGDYDVIAIRYNPRALRSSVWLAKGTEVCQSSVREEHPIRKQLHAQALQHAKAAQARERSQQRAARRARAQAKRKNARRARAKHRSTVGRR